MRFDYSLNPFAAVCAIILGSALAYVVVSGQFPENADLFDFVNAGSSCFLASVLVGAGVTTLAERFIDREEEIQDLKAKVQAVAIERDTAIAYVKEQGKNFDNVVAEYEDVKRRFHLVPRDTDEETPDNVVRLHS
jgi:hypothetical protein